MRNPLQRGSRPRSASNSSHMPGTELLNLLGVEPPRAGGVPEPQVVLGMLSRGLVNPQECGVPTVPVADSWLRISALPSRDAEVLPPIESLLGSVSGGLVGLSLLIHHDDQDGMSFWLSGGKPAIRERLRCLLAPACDVIPGSPPPLARPRLAGLRYRLQPEVAEVSALAEPVFPLLERLGSVTGAWSVLVSLRPVAQGEILHAQDQVNRLGQAAGENLSTTRQDATNRSHTTVSAGWQRVQDWVSVLHGQLSQGASTGLWKTAAWASATDEWTLDQVLAGLRGTVNDDQGRRFMPMDASIVDASASSPSSVLTTRQVAGMFSAPAASLPGLGVRPSPPASRRPATGRHCITLGTYWSTALPAKIGLEDLEGHTFVTGTTGSGKTTTLHRLLAEAWNDHGVPFLVLDPVKDEYSPVAGLFRGGLKVVTGGELSLNLMKAWPGEDARRHISQVAQAFRGAFIMPSPTPYVVTQLFDQIAMQPGGPEGTELFDARDLVDPLVASLGYAGEAQSNIRASLLTRLNVLLAPLRAHRFAWPDSDMVEEILTRPSVVTLADLVDDEERSFLVLLLALATGAHARRRKVRRAVEHLLVLEEAHRVLPEVGQAAADPESGSARAASSDLLSAMLAEVRSYGEQVIVVDQSPAKVSSEVIRNTNLKIVHRVVSPQDQATVAAAVGIDPDASLLLGTLSRGQAIISSRLEPAPQSIAVGRAEVVDASAKATAVPRNPPGWPCCAENSAESHYRAWRGAALAEPAMALFLIGCRAGELGGDGRELRKRVMELLHPVAQTLSARVDCLAWAGLRRLLVAERGLGLVPNARVLNGTHAALFDLWHTKASVSLQSALDFSVPGATIRRVCPECGSACSLRVPAWAFLVGSARTGLLALAGPGWRSDLSEITIWVKNEHATHTALLGEAGATTMLRCQVRQSVRRNRLSVDVAEQILKRAGVPST